MSEVKGIALGEEGLLLVQKKGVWVVPGAEKLPQESDLECLTRLLDSQFKASASTKKTYRDIGDSHTYIVGFDTSLRGDEMLWTRNPEEHSISDTTAQIVRALREDGYL